MNKKPLVSVIVAIYNGEKYLNECVDSILSQTYKNLEIILVDDGSPDNCPKICDEYAKKDKRIKVIHKKNGGVSSARNSGIADSSGDYICIVDQDDWLSNDHVDYLFQLIQKCKAEVAVVPNVIYASGKKEVYDEKHESSKVEKWTNEDAACEMLYSKMEIGPWSKMISKEMLEKKNISFYEDIYGGDGYAFSVESFMAANKVAVGYKGIYYYRVDNYASEMSKFRPRTLQCSIKAVNIMREEFKNVSMRMNRATKYAQWRVNISFLNNLIASNLVSDYPKEYKYLVHNCRRYAYRSFSAEVPLKRKIKDLLYFVSPVLVSKINVARNSKRDFNKEQEG